MKALTAWNSILQNSSVDTVFLALFYHFDVLKTKFKELLGQILIVVFILVAALERTLCTLVVAVGWNFFCSVFLVGAVEAKWINWQIRFTTSNIIPVNYKATISFTSKLPLESCLCHFPKALNVSCISFLWPSSMWIGCKIGISWLLLLCIAYCTDFSVGFIRLNKLSCGSFSGSETIRHTMALTVYNRSPEQTSHVQVASSEWCLNYVNSQIVPSQYLRECWLFWS